MNAIYIELPITWAMNRCGMVNQHNICLCFSKKKPKLSLQLLNTWKNKVSLNKRLISVRLGDVRDFWKSSLAWALIFEIFSLYP